jgi:hypothetical protein
VHAKTASVLERHSLAWPVVGEEVIDLRRMEMLRRREVGPQDWQVRQQRKQVMTWGTLGKKASQASGMVMSTAAMASEQ